jgi:curli biogenesis system outer membrane secretion channel CsgG
VRTRVARLACLALVVLPLVVVPSADASTIVGKAPGKLVKFGGSPFGRVLAVEAATARPKAGAAYTKSGRYRLTVPRGVYVVLAPVKGKGGRTLTARSRIFKVRAGQRKQVKTSRKTPKPRKRKKRRPAQRADAAAGKRIKVSVFNSSIRGGGLERLGAGLDDILITDLFQAKEGIDCPVEVFVDRQSDDFRAIQQEVRLQQSPAFDPSTRVTPLYNTRRYTPTIRITAALTASGNSLTGSIVAREISSGQVKASQPVARSTNSILNGFPQELHKLLEELCEPGPPERFAGTVSGTGTYDADELGAGNSLRATWNATIQLVEVPPVAQFPGAPAGQYKLESGSLHYAFNGSVGDCTVAGSGPIDLASQPDLAGAGVLTLFDGDPRTYGFVIPLPVLASVDGTRSNCDDPDDNGKEFDVVPGLGVPAMVNAPLPGGPVGDDWSMSGTGSGNGGPGTPEQTWQWSLTPSE